MSLRGDDRGVVIQVGAVLLFAFVILAITMYQVQVIPDQNEEIEYKHNEQVQDQLLDVRSGILTTAGGGGSRSVSVTLGTNYPSRTIFLNPSPPSGKLRTIGTTNESINVTIENAKGTGSETSDFWNGTNRSYSTGALVYEPFYHRYDNAPTTIYEHSLLANQFDDVALAKTDQTIVQDETITLVTLNGSYQEASTRTVALDTQSLSTSTETIEVTNDGGNLTLSLPTLLGNETWGPLLEPELETEGGNVSNYEVLDSPNGPNTLIVELVPGTYTLQMAKVGVGSNTKKPPESAHYITSQDTNKSLQTGGTVSLAVEVRDRYNNPVEGETVSIESPATPQTAETGSDGKVTFTYDAPDTDEVTAYIDGNTSEDKRVVFDIEVTAPSGGGGGGSGVYSINWQDPSASLGTQSPCDSDDCVWNVSRDSNSSLRLETETSPIIENLDTEFKVNNSSIAYISDSEPDTGADGRAEATLTSMANGTVKVFVITGDSSDLINVSIENIGELIYNSDASAVAEPNSDIKSGVEFSVTNERKSDIRVTEIYVEPESTNIARLSDPSTQEGKFESEFYVEAGTDTYVTDFNGGKLIPTWFDLSEPFYPNEHLIEADETATYTLYQFLDNSDQPVDMAGKNVTITLKYTVNNATATKTFNLEPPAFLTADTGSDFTVDEGTTGTLDGSASADPDGSITTYDWSISSNPDGASISISDANPSDPTATFDASGADVDGDKTVEVTLTVTDDDGNTASDVVNVTVKDLDGAKPLSYVAGSGNADSYENGSLVFDISNNEGTSITIQNISVSVKEGPATHIGNSHSADPVRIFDNSGSDEGYRTANMSLEEIASLDDTARISGHSKGTVELRDFVKETGQSQDPESVAGRTVTVTVGLADGRQVSFTIDDI